MENVFDTLMERGFIQQTTDDEALKEILGESFITCYIGFDPTSDSFHVGSLIPIMALAHMQRAGHKPIALIGGGTGLVGDPSGKTEMRQLLTLEQIESNAKGLKEQLKRFLDFNEDKALMLNNADWLVPLNYIEFLRDIGRHFSVNRMLAAESYRQRLATGLSFIEFNYMLLQAYDFYYLYKHYNCILQMGGNDQWGNIVAGIELVRRMEGATIYGMTFPLITTATGEKMGKTAKGAVWLDPKRTTPYEYYQYWINCDDRDVERFLAFFTFLDMEEIKRITSVTGEELKKAKEILAFETTKICHGEEAAKKAQESSKALFAGKGDEISSVPTKYIEPEKVEKGMPAFVFLARVGLCKSSSEARRLITQGGIYIEKERVKNPEMFITLDHFPKGELLLRAGKKRYLRVVLDKN